MKSFSEIDFDLIKEVLPILKAKKEEVDTKIKNIKKSNPSCSKPIVFDIGINSAFLELYQPDEVRKFYELSAPSPQILTIGEILVGLLGEWDLTPVSNPEERWKKIQSFFRKETQENICNVPY